MKSLLISLVVLTGCYTTVRPMPVRVEADICPTSPYPRLACERDWVWIPGYYDRFHRWHAGGYSRRPGHPYRR